MKKNDIEKSLKRFLKRKVSYSLSLLVAFMITGGISLSAGITVEEIQETKGDLLTKIQLEKEEIRKKIAENERLIKEYNSEFVELVRKGDYYSKPLIPSTQIFLSYSHNDSGKMKDRTEIEFKETIDAVNRYFGLSRSGASMYATVTAGKDVIIPGNGVVSDNEIFRETIDLGANIKIVDPKLPAINPNVSVSVSVSAPSVNLGTLPGVINPTVGTMPTITIPTITHPTAPSGVSVTVTTPSAVDRIVVATPTITTPTTPNDKNINVSAPATPTGFEPTTVTAPTAPTIPVIVPPTIPSFASNVVSSGNGTSNAVDQRNLSNGVIEMVAIKSGDFNLKRDTGSTWTYEYNGYSGANVWAVTSATWDGNTAVGAGLTWNAASRISTASTGGQLGFQKLVGNSTQSTMLSNATFLYTRGMESSTATLGEFVHMDIHGAAAPAGQRAGLVIGTAGLSNQNAILAAYDDAGDNINWTYGTTKNTTAASSRYTWINSGKIVIEGGNTSVTNHYDHHGIVNAKSIAINTGDIIFQPFFDGTNYYQKYTSGFVMSLDGNTVHHIMYNGSTGSIKTYTQTASIFLSGSSSAGRPLSIVNRGTLEMYGENSAGIYLKTDSNNELYFTTDNFAFNSSTNTVTAGSYKPIKLFGDSSIGLYGAATIGSTIGNLAVDIGESGKGNQNFTTSTASGSNNGTNLTNYDINSSGANENIEGSYGIIAHAPLNLTSHQIRIYNKTEKNVGVYPNANVLLNLGGGEIVLNGGNKNIGIYVNNMGNITSTGNISLINGIGNMAIFARGTGKTVNINTITATNTVDSVVVYGENGAIITANELNVTSSVGANPTTTNGKDTGAAFAKGANTIIAINRGAGTPSTPNISITGKKLDDADRYVGFGIMAENGGVINAMQNYIKVVNGSTAVASIGTNSNINLFGGTVEFDGSGYAVYSDGNGKVNLSNAKLILKGKATAFDVDMLAGTPPVTLNANSRIHVDSNDVVVFNLKNATGLSTNGLEASITTALGTALGGANLSNLIVAGGGIDKYKIAAVDGGTIAIGNLDKTGTGALSDTQAQKDGNFYYNRFLGQRLVATATGSTISAVLNNTQASNYNNQVVGLEMNSSKLAISNTEAGIILNNNSTVIADRNDSGLGAIGAFINYGTVGIDITSSIKVEKESNTANNQAVGVYAVNGSNVSTSGIIEVGGSQSIGILGMAYREDNLGNPVLNEFGASAAGQGKVTIVNGITGNIELDGTGTVGIYADNNNPSGTKADVTVTNNGRIEVGNSTASNAAIGIYGNKATISNQGTISVGDGGVAIYAKNLTEITRLGILDLGADAVGVMLDGTSDITATSVTLTSNNTGTIGKTGIFYKGTGAESKTIGVSVNASAFDKGTAVYAEDMSISSSSTLNIGKDGVGIFVKGTNANIGINAGTGIIDLNTGKTGAVGMYTKTANITNNGTINVRDASQIGMYAEGTNVKATNIGTINLNVDGSTGIYVKTGAEIDLNTGNNIVFGGNSSVGVFAEDASITFKDNMTFTNNNENKNIYVYGKDATVTIDAGKTVTIDGVTAPATLGNKTVGIYLENTATGSTFNGNGQLNVDNRAVGIYSKGNNTLNVKVTADGEKTTGIFIDGNSTIAGTVTARDTTAGLIGSVGVYGNGGIVTIGAGGLTLNTNSGKGTGMYLTDGASAASGTITVNNTSGIENIGVYYSKGTASGTVTNSSALFLAGSNSIGIYAADGITLVNSANISSTAGQTDNIASYVGGGSQLTSNGTISLNDTSGGIGIYTEEGKGINSGTISLNGTAGSMVGMVSEALAGKTAEVQNTNIINAGNNLGMYIAGAGTSSGKNTGTITTTGTGTGVYIDGSGNSFNGTGGTINSNAVGIYLKDTITGTVADTGTLNISSGGVGVYANNAKVDFTTNVNGSGAVGVAAENNSVISGNITTGQGSVGAYLLDDTAAIDNGVNISTSINGSGTSIGILFDSAITSSYTMNNVTVDAKDGVGIYLGGIGMTLNHNGSVNTSNGTGIYVPAGTTLNTNTSIMNINGGAGIYVNGGTANLGTTGALTFNFLTNGGIGVYNDGGNIVLGNNINITGSGSLAATKNGSLSSSGNLNISTGAVGLLGSYDNGTTSAQNILNTGNINVTAGGMGLAALVGGTNPTGTVTITNAGTINASGQSLALAPSIGIYTDIADVLNTGNINVGTNGVGIYADGAATTIQNDNMTMTGTDGVGVYIKGATVGFVSNNISSIGSRNIGVALDGVTSSINAGTITLGNESVGIMATGTTNSTLDGSISVGDSTSAKSAVGVVANGSSNVTIAGTANITAGNGGIGAYAQGAGTTLNIANAGNINVGTNGIYMYSKDAVLNFTGNITANNQIGIVADGGSINAGSSVISVLNGGIGAYVKGSAPSFGTTAITVGSGNASKYSMGVFYDGVGSIGTAPLITQTGSYNIGMVLNNSTGTVSSASVSGNNQVGIIAQNSSVLTVSGPVTVNGNNNAGVYGNNSNITVIGNIALGNSSAPLPGEDTMANASVGVYTFGGTYSGNGNITAGSYSIGVYGKNLTQNITQTGTAMNVANNGVGVYGSGTGSGATPTITIGMTNTTLGANNAIGVYAKNANSSVTGNMSIGTNTSAGIVSEGNGNVTYNGAMTIANKVASGSVGIYKLNGTGTINTSGNLNIGISGYGIYAKQQGNLSAVINNASNMTLGESAVGILSLGGNTVNNSGNITVGTTNVNGDHDDATNHLNSVGIYMGRGGASTAPSIGTNTGTITVNHDHSVGVYVEGAGVTFRNALGGTINVNNGGIGILARDHAVAVNNGTINLGSTLAVCDIPTVGMAAYTGANIVNNGTINVLDGVGMLVGVGSFLTNASGATINVSNGIGIQGNGTIVNSGTITILPGGTGTTIDSTGSSSANIGSVKIDANGNITISDKYVSIGGTLTTTGAIIVNGAYVDVTTNTPLFNAHSVSGEVRLLPNFAATGNGISYEIKGFVNTAMGTITGTKLTPVTSPLFIAKITTSGDLVIAKRPYADMTIGEQFDALDKGLDNILKNSGGNGKDAEILKGLNKYLDGLPSGEFGRETSKKLSEMRGDIYSTIQGRMQDINRAFDNSFYELESSYNLTKDSGKYSVIYTDGDYKDPTLGIDDYDYKVMGVLYMKEKEGTTYGNKYGYTLGFTGSKFKFDDGGSKEDVYSLRAGVHKVTNLSDEYKLSWLTRVELGYNRHLAKRKLNLHETFENEGEYNTYTVALDNRLTKTIYTDLSRQLDIYTDLDIEYGKVDGFTESGNLEVQIKDNDYLSAQIGAGIKAQQRIYAVNDISVKVTADVKYAYELGKNYEGNKARLKNGEEGYYSLITPEEREGKVTGKIGLTIEKANHMGVTFEVEAADEGHKKDSSIKYGMRFNYKF